VTAVRDALDRHGLRRGSGGGLVPGKVGVPDDEWHAAVEEAAAVRALADAQVVVVHVNDAVRGGRRTSRSPSSASCPPPPDRSTLAASSPHSARPPTTAR